MIHKAIKKVPVSTPKRAPLEFEGSPESAEGPQTSSLRLQPQSNVAI